MRSVNWLRQTMNCLLSIREQTGFKDLQTLDQSCITNLTNFALADAVYLIRKEDALISTVKSYKEDLLRTEYVENQHLDRLLCNNEIVILTANLNADVQKIVGSVELVTIIPIDNTYFDGKIILCYNNPVQHSDDYLDFIQVCQMELKQLYQTFFGKEQLRQFQVRFHGMLQTITQSIVFIDSNGVYCWINNNAARLLNLNEENPQPAEVRRAMMALKNHAVPDTDCERNDDLFTSASPQVLFWRFKEPDSKVLKVTFMTIDAEASKGVMWIFDDVTKEHTYERTLEELNRQLAIQSRRTEEINKRYQYASRASSEAIWDWDLVQETIYWGEGIETTFGYRRHELSHRKDSWLNNIHPEDLPGVKADVELALNGKNVHWSGEYRFRRADGTYAFVLDKCFIIRNKAGQAIRVVGAMQDVSERVQSVIEAKAFADDLYKRNKELQQFGYIVSHNLRAPVANIIGITDLLEIDNANPEVVSNYTTRLKAAVGNLDEVLKDLSKILTAGDDSAAMPKEMVEIDDVLNNVKTDLSELISYNNALIISPEKSYRFFTYKAYLYSVFYNLISNALKYRSEKTPEVHIDVQQHKDHYVAKISDNGIGIDLSKHGEELGQPYKRFHTTVEGKGLGLFLVKSHVEAINGQLTIESTPGKGTTFIITVPAS